MENALRQLVWDRAGSLCEYCRMPDEFDPLPFCMDHIIAQQHRGPTIANNLALSCFNCNSYKGPNIAGIDPQTDTIVRLFHPRTDHWPEHFHWQGPVLIGRTATGRATIEVLNINDTQRVQHRRSLIEERAFPLN